MCAALPSRLRGGGGGGGGGGVLGGPASQRTGSSTSELSPGVPTFVRPIPLAAPRAPPRRRAAEGGGSGNGATGHGGGCVAVVVRVCYRLPTTGAGADDCCLYKP